MLRRARAVGGRALRLRALRAPKNAALGRVPWLAGRRSPSLLPTLANFQSSISHSAQPSPAQSHLKPHPARWNSQSQKTCPSYKRLNPVCQHEVCKVRASVPCKNLPKRAPTNIYALFLCRELDQDLVPEWRAKYLNYKVSKCKTCPRMMCSTLSARLFVSLPAA